MVIRQLERHLRSDTTGDSKYGQVAWVLTVSTDHPHYNRRAVSSAMLPLKAGMVLHQRLPFHDVGGYTAFFFFYRRDKSILYHWFCYSTVWDSLHMHVRPGGQYTAQLTLMPKGCAGFPASNVQL